MINTHQVDQLLRNTKLSSMADLIQFILDNVLKLINFEPIEDLSLRISQLEKPQGLDSIMIEQVKALIEAMLQQKQDQIKRQMERNIQSNLSLIAQQENSRRTLREIDFYQLLSNQNIQKNTQEHSKNQSFSFQHQSQIDTLKKEVNEIKVLVSRKCDRREINQLKIEVQKDLSNKMAIIETEKIVEKFQKDVFLKLSETNNNFQKIQYEIKKSLLSEVSILKKQLLENMKMSELKEKVNKVQKKVKRSAQENANTFQQIAEQFDIFKKDSKDSIQQICNLIENMDLKLKNNTQIIRTISNKLKSQFDKPFSTAAWLAQNKISLKNMGISWEKQYSSQNQQLYRFEAGKSQVIITEPGFYSIQSYVSGCQKAPQLLVNSQNLATFESVSTNKFGYFKVREVMKLMQNTNKISVKLENQTKYSNALLKISRIG